MVWTAFLAISQTVTSSLRPLTSQEIHTIVQTPALDGSGSLDNWGNARTGSDRASLNLNWNNPSAHGDQLSTNLMATQAVNYGRLAYSVPVGYRGARLGPCFIRVWCGWRHQPSSTVHVMPTSPTALSPNAKSNRVSWACRVNGLQSEKPALFGA